MLEAGKRNRVDGAGAGAGDIPGGAGIGPGQRIGDGAADKILDAGEGADAGCGRILQINADVRRVSAVVERVIAVATVDRAGNPGAVSEGEGVDPGAAGQILDAGEGEAAVQCPFVDAADLPIIGTVRPCELVTGAAK